MPRALRLFRYALPYWKGWALILTATLFSIAPGVLQPWPMKIFVDNVLAGAGATASLPHYLRILPATATREGLLAWVIAGSLLVFLLNSGFDAVLTSSWVRVGQRMVHDLSEQLFANIQRRSLLFHGQRSIAESMTCVTGDSWCLNTVVGSFLLGPLQAAMSASVMLTLMWRLDPRLTWLALLAAPLMTGASLLLGRRMRSAAKRRRDLEVRMTSHVHQTLSGISLVQAFTREDLEQRRFQECAANAIQSQLANTFVRNVSALTSGAIATLGTAAILLVGGRRVLAGQLSVGGLLVFLSYLKSLQGQMSVFAGIYGGLQRTAPSIERVLDLLEERPEVSDSPHAERLSNVLGHVRFEDVSFGYAAGRPVVAGLSFEAKPGETVAIVGPTGAGKSTLASLLLRFYDPWRGRITLDGRDLRQVRLRDLRARMSIVLQEPFLFPLSIAENIAYSRPEATRAEIIAAARAANAHAFIDRLPNGYDTVIGERGATLSGGEKQRIAIARALLKDAPLLILDEPTSALDAETERLVIEAMDRLAAGRTTLVIAHRLSTIRRADRILVLEHGAITEQGSHRELLAKQNLYSRLYALQAGAAEPLAEPQL